MIQTTTWHPDTCDCILQMTWDDSVPPEEIVCTYAQHEKVCENHAKLDPKEAHDAVWLENRSLHSIREKIKELHGVELGPRDFSGYIAGLSKTEQSNINRHFALESERIRRHHNTQPVGSIPANLPS